MVRIGNAQGFWGDRSEAAAEMLAREPELDYLTLDYLAEVSMSILAQQQARDPSRGYARDFVDVVRSLAPYWANGGKCRLLANAGGLNPQACAEACREALQAVGCRDMRIAIVSGDDVLSVIRQTQDLATTESFKNLDDGRPLAEVADRLITANAYVGAGPIVKALETGAQIVITGRVADPSLCVAVAAHHFQWSLQDWDRLAGATVAGHLIECGTQATGGIHTDWLSVPSPGSMGFPIVEVASDGSCVVAKPQGSGGRVNALTVKEQLLYEIGDPAHYLSPDVEVSFLSLTVDDLGENRVRVHGAKGSPPPATYKVSATWRDGYRAAGTLVVVGRDAVLKARRCADIVLERLNAAGHTPRDAVVECLGAGDCFRPATDHSENAQECVLRIAIESESKTTVDRFSREMTPLITAGPPGVCGYAEGRPKVHEIYRYWPCLIPRDVVTSEVFAFDVAASQGAAFSASLPKPLVCTTSNPERGLYERSSATGTLESIAVARSGDKGIHANVGVIARDPNDSVRLARWLTADRVAAWFQGQNVDSVTRYEVPNLGAFNFIVKGILRRSLQSDAQGKTLGQSLLQMPLDGLEPRA